MGTWGAGAFDNDSAEELVEELESGSIDDRRTVLGRLLAESVAQGENADPSEVVAAATIVAASLEGSVAAERYPEVAGWLDGEAVVALKEPAARAIRLCLPKGGWFWRSWTEAADRSEASAFVDGLVAELEGSA